MCVSILSTCIEYLKTHLHTQLLTHTDLKNPNSLKRFHLRMYTGYRPLSLPPFKSAWAEEYSFPRPIIASEIILRPELPSGKPRESSVKLQLQLYGNAYGTRFCPPCWCSLSYCMYQFHPLKCFDSILEEPLDVEDGSTVTFQFNDLSGKDDPHFVHTLCLEETGVCVADLCLALY